MQFRQKFCVLILLTGLLCAFAANASAQSTDQSLPTPILSNEISGKIDALDLGDPRLTRHFYAFEGTPGDLLITLESKNLNGDIDVFTAITFRPLMKTTMYANLPGREITKGIYLRTRQILILRVEARTPNDEPGTYHIRFAGTFARFSGGIPVAETAETTETAPEKTGANRLTSVGATIPRPATETAETAEPKPSPEKTAEETAAAKTTEKPAATTTSRRTTARNPRRAPRPAPAKPQPKKIESTAKTETEAAKTEPKETEEKAAVPERPAEEKPPASEKPKSQEVAPQPGARLIIEEKDGTRIERPMSTVRRLIVEGGTIVIVLKTGRTERIPMSDVARMAIEPQ